MLCVEERKFPMKKHKLYQIYLVSYNRENRHVAVPVGDVPPPNGVLVGKPVKSSSARSAVRKVNTRTEWGNYPNISNKKYKKGAYGI
jgi:hypothetical protein